MPIPITCTQCKMQLRATDDAVGKKVKCPKCGAVLPVMAVGAKATEQISAMPPPKPSPSAPALPPGGKPPTDVGLPALPPPPRHLENANTGLQTGMGIAALSLGTVGAIFAVIPLCGFFVALPVCGIALVLGLVGLITAMTKKVAYGFPIAGVSVSAAGLALAFFWWIWFTAATHQVAKDLEKAAKGLADDVQKQQDKLFQDAMKDLGKGLDKVVDKAGADGKKASADSPTALDALKQLGAEVITDTSGFVNEVKLVRKHELKDDDLAHLSGLPRLEVLKLTGSPVTDSGLQNLKGITTLKELYLAETKVTDAGMMHLLGLRLERLVLFGTAVSDAKVTELRKRFGEGVLK